MTLTAPQPGSYAAQRQQVQAQEGRTNEERKRWAAQLYALRQRFPGASDREFILDYSSGKYSGRYQRALHAGYAIQEGQDWAGRDYAEVSEVGGALSDGDSPADIAARLAAGEPARRRKRGVTTIQVPAADLPMIQAAREEVSRMDRLNGPEAAARMIGAYAGQHPIMREAMRATDATGRALVENLVQAVDDRKDYRNLLAQQGCVICGSHERVQLHHQQTDADDRHRTHSFLLPLCERHHIARPGDTEAVHAQQFETLRQNPDYWRAAFRAVSAAAEATRPGGEQ